MGNKVENFLKSGTQNLIQSCYDNFVQTNAEHRARFGLKVVLKRESVGECCEWCNALLGTYDIDKAPDDIYKRHKNCTCIVTAKSEKGYTDVWSKKTYATEREARKERVNRIMKELESNKADTKRKILELGKFLQNKEVENLKRKAELKLLNDIISDFDEYRFGLWNDEKVSFYRKGDKIYVMNNKLQILDTISKYDDAFVNASAIRK